MQLFQALFPGHRSLSFAGLLFGSGLLAVALANPATWLQSGFETALNGSNASLQLADARTPAFPPIAGSESYWLGTSSATANKHLMQPATWQAPIAQGDRFIISSARSASDSANREFEVITIEPLLSAHSLKDRKKASAEKDQFLVICRSTDKRNPEILKFLVDSTTGLPWASAPKRTAHAL